MKKKTRKIILSVFFILLACYILYNVIGFAGYYFVVKSYAKEANEKKIILLYQTDHAVLLHTCRELHKEGLRGEYHFEEQTPPEIDKFPKIILALKPYRVTIDDSKVNIVLMRGIGGCGVVAYPENFVEPYKGYNIGDKKLLDGLWYYDAGYSRGFEVEYDEYLQSLKPKE